MWDFSDSARDALRGSHTAVNRFEVWHSGQVSATLDVLGGGVTVDADRTVRRNLECTLTDLTGTLSGTDANDLLDPRECEVAPWRGVRVATGDELAPQGVFQLTARQVADGPDGLMISLSGQDRTIIYQGPMTSPLGISAGTPVEEAIEQLLIRRNSGLSMQTYVTGFTCGPLVYAPNIDVWAEAERLAESVGAKLYHDRTGQVVLAQALPVRNAIPPTYADGGRLLTAVRDENADSIVNVVVVENTAGTIRVTAEDDDPSSPTYSRGTKRRVVTVTNPHVGTVEQATQAAYARLATELSKADVTSFTAVPDPAQDVDEYVVVHRPRAGLNYRGVTVATLSMPLAVTDSMEAGCRKSILTPTGWVDAPNTGEFQ